MAKNFGLLKILRAQKKIKFSFPDFFVHISWSTLLRALGNLRCSTSVFFTMHIFAFEGVFTKIGGIFFSNFTALQHWDPIRMHPFGWLLWYALICIFLEHSICWLHFSCFLYASFYCNFECIFYASFLLYFWGASFWLSIFCVCVQFALKWESKPSTSQLGC